MIECMSGLPGWHLGFSFPQGRYTTAGTIYDHVLTPALDRALSSTDHLKLMPKLGGRPFEGYDLAAALGRWS